MSDDDGGTLPIVPGRWYATTSPEGRAIIELDAGRGFAEPDRSESSVAPIYHDLLEKVEPRRRAKNRPPPHKRVAKRRRRTALAKHHRKAMNLKARGETTFPKRPKKRKVKR